MKKREAFVTSLHLNEGERQVDVLFGCAREVGQAQPLRLLDLSKELTSLPALLFTVIQLLPSYQCHDNIWIVSNQVLLKTTSSITKDHLSPLMLALVLPCLRPYLPSARAVSWKKSQASYFKTQLG